MNGRLVTHLGESLTVSTLTNDTYEKSLKYARATPIERARSNGSLDRFPRAAQKTGEFEKKSRSGQEAVSYAFETLSNVAQEGHTQWSIVYDQKRGKIYFRTSQSPQIKVIDTTSFDYSGGSTVKVLDINSKDSGDVTAKFTDYTRGANRDLIERAFSGTDFLKSVSTRERDFYASHPENFTCKSTQHADGRRP